MSSLSNRFVSSVVVFLVGKCRGRIVVRGRVFFLFSFWPLSRAHALAAHQLFILSFFSKGKRESAVRRRALFASLVRSRPLLARARARSAARSAPATEPGTTELGSAMAAVCTTINFLHRERHARPSSATMREVVCRIKLIEQLQILGIHLMNLNRNT